MNLLCVNCFATASSTTSTSSNIDISENCLSEALFLAESFMVGFGGEDNEFASFSELYDLSGNLCAYCFNFEPCGYVIVNVGDYDVPNLSVTNETPFPTLDSSENCVYIYCGLTNYYTLSGDGILTSLLTGEEIDINGMEFDDSSNYDSEAREEMLSLFVGSGLAQFRTEADILEMTDNEPMPWKNSFTCGLQALTIELKYLYDKNLFQAPSSLSMMNGMIQPYLVNNMYIENNVDVGLNGYDIVHGSFLQLSYKGINQFFEDVGSAVRADDKNYTNNNVTLMRTSFVNDIPVMLGTKANMEVTEGVVKAHWYVAYGYKVLNTVEYFVVNNGYGDNGVLLPVSTDLYDEIIIFS